MHTVWHPDWVMPDEDDVSITFKLKGRNDGRVTLCAYRNETCRKGITFGIGTLSNAEITIFDLTSKDAAFTFISPLYNGLIMDEDEYREFWVQWNPAGEALLGMGSVPYRNVIQSYRLDSLGPENGYAMPVIKRFHTKYISFSAWDVPVSYKDIVISSSVAPRSTPDAPLFSTSADYDQFNQPNMLKLSPHAFEVVLEMQVLSDAIIGFMQTHKHSKDDEYAYEVVLNQATDRHRYTYPRNIIRVGEGQGGIVFAESNNTEVVSAAEFRPFWIRLKDRQMSVGEGTVVGEYQFMETGPEPLPPIPSKTVVMGFKCDLFSIGVRVLSVKSQHGDIDVNFVAQELLTGTYELEKSTVKPIQIRTGQDRPWRTFVPPVVPQECDSGSICAPPPGYPHSILLTHVQPRYQWWHSGAFCAELSIQQSALSQGIWASQKVIRKATPASEFTVFFGNPIQGYEVVPPNIAGTFRTLGIRFSAFTTRRPTCPRPATRRITSGSRSTSPRATPSCGSSSRRSASITTTPRPSWVTTASTRSVTPRSMATTSWRTRPARTCCGTTGASTR